MEQKMGLTLLENGPAIFTLPTGKKAALCRCGKSDNPFCNGAHTKGGKTAPPANITITCSPDYCNIEVEE